MLIGLNQSVKPMALYYQCLIICEGNAYKNVFWIWGSFSKWPPSDSKMTWLKSKHFCQWNVEDIKIKTHARTDVHTHTHTHTHTYTHTHTHTHTHTRTHTHAHTSTIATTVNCIRCKRGEHQWPTRTKRVKLAIYTYLFVYCPLVFQGMSPLNCPTVVSRIELSKTKRSKSMSLFIFGLNVWRWLRRHSRFLSNCWQHAILL